MLEHNDIRIVRITKHPGTNESKIKAFVDISLRGDFVIRGLRILEGKNGLFLGMPQTKTKDGLWYKRFYPQTSQAARILTEVVLEAFKK